MKFKELLAKEHPENVSNEYKGGCHDCPYDYKYETEEESRENCSVNDGQGCTYCWDREVSEYLKLVSKLDNDNLIPTQIAMLKDLEE